MALCVIAVASINPHHVFAPTEAPSAKIGGFKVDGPGAKRERLRDHKRPGSSPRQTRDTTCVDSHCGSGQSFISGI